MDHILNENGVLQDTNKHIYDIGKKKELTIKTGLYKGKWYAGHNYYNKDGCFYGAGSPAMPKICRAHKTEQDAIKFELEFIYNRYKEQGLTKHINQETLF